MSAADTRTVVKAVRDALGSLELRPQDGAAVRLAVAYAREIDADPTQLGKLGPALLSALESLGMSPRARAALAGKKGGEPDAPAANPIDELRKRRRARLGDA